MNYIIKEIERLDPILKDKIAIYNDQLEQHGESLSSYPEEELEQLRRLRIAKAQAELIVDGLKEKEV